MSLRDYFAGQALNGMLHYEYDCDNAEVYTKNAYKFADAMLEERAKGRSA